MACCGKRAAPTRTAAPTVSIQRTPVTSTHKPAPDETWVEMVFTGSSIGNQTIYGPSHNRYKYGRNQRKLYFWAHPDDVKFLLGVGLFQVYVLPVAKKPKPKPAPVPEPEIPPEPEQVLTPEPEPVIIDRVVPATGQAKNLARQAGVMLIDIPFEEGVRIGIADVRAYLDEVGIAY